MLFEIFEEDRRWRWAPFLAQVFFVPIAAELLTSVVFLLGWIVDNSLLSASAPFLELSIAAISFIGGFTLPRTFSSLVQGGKWIWVPVLALGIVGFISDLNTLSKSAYESPSMVAAMWLYDTGGDEGGRLILVTAPLFATTSYSLGVFLTSRKGKQRVPESE